MQYQIFIKNPPAKSALQKAFLPCKTEMENLLKIIMQLLRAVNCALQCSKLFYFKVYSKFLRRDLQSSYSFPKVQNEGGPEIFEEKM